MKILITGGAGMIGSNLVRRLTAEGHEVSVVDNLWRGRREYLLDEDGREVIDLDRHLHVRDLSREGAMDDLLASVDTVFHLADVVAGIGYVFNHQGSIFRQNLLINSNVIDSVRNNPVGGFIYVGTACSFPQKLQFGVEAPPLREEDLYPAHPESAYGWSKLMGEYETGLLEEESGIPTAVLSLHNVYGAPCDFSDTSGQVIPSLIRKAIEYPAEPFVVWGTGAQGRAFVHVDDIVNGLVACMERGMGQGAIQLGPDVCTTIREVAETIVEVSGKKIDIEFDASRPEGDRGRRADYSKARRILDWTPRVSLREGLKQTYEWVEQRIRSS